MNAKITASANGAKRYFATPERKKMGTKTIQIHIVETSAGVAISPAQSRIASNTGLPWARYRSIFSIVTVASSTRIPTANARPPNVMMLIVCPSALKTAIEERMAKGIEMAMISVLFQSPRKKQNHNCSQAPRNYGFTNNAFNRAANEDRLIK